MSRKAILFVLLGFGFSACDRAETVKSSPTSSASQPVQSASIEAPTQAVASASASASAAVAENAPVPGAGWSGDYTAKKPSIELPKKITDETWKKDTGEKAAGPGKLSLSVNDGVVSGTASGALGEQIVVGTFDGKSLRVSLNPKDPMLALAMTGTAVGDLSDGVIKGTLRCSGPDAVVVREASFELRSAK